MIFTLSPSSITKNILAVTLPDETANDVFCEIYNQFKIKHLLKITDLYASSWIRVPNGKKTFFFALDQKYHNDLYTTLVKMGLGDWLRHLSYDEVDQIIAHDEFHFYDLHKYTHQAIIDTDIRTIRSWMKNLCKDDCIIIPFRAGSKIYCKTERDFSLLRLKFDMIPMDGFYPS